MEITLNSPKYAEAQSLQYQMYKKQKDRKKRKNFVPELFERYFRRNEGTTDYATIPGVTLTGHFVIEFDLLVTSFSGGVKVMDGGTDGGADRLDVNITALGAFDVRDYFKLYVNGVAGATVTLNQLNKIRIVRDATDANQSTRFLDILLARVNNTGNNLPGILANLKIWDNGTLIRDYPLDDNSDILRDRANGQSGTVINGNASDWGLFQQQATGEWLGQELVVNGGFDSDLSGWEVTEAGQTVEWDNGRLHIITDGTGCGVRQVLLSDNITYQVALNYEAVSGGLKYQVGASSYVLNSTQSVLSDHLADGANFFLYRGIGAGEGYFDNVSVKEVLKNA